MPELFDPSAPGVTRQMMIDWMHIHHPMTKLRPRIGINELSDLVRGEQPQCELYILRLVLHSGYQLLLITMTSFRCLVLFFQSSPRWLVMRLL